MADTTSTPALKPYQQYVLAILDSKFTTAVLAIVATLATQHVSAPKPAAAALPAIATPAPVVNFTIDMAPIARAISDGIAGFRAEMAQAREAKGNLKTVKGTIK